MWNSIFFLPFKHWSIKHQKARDHELSSAEETRDVEELKSAEHYRSSSTRTLSLNQHRTHHRQYVPLPNVDWLWTQNPRPSDGLSRPGTSWKEAPKLDNLSVHRVVYNQPTGLDVCRQKVSLLEWLTTRLFDDGSRCPIRFLSAPL